MDIGSYIDGRSLAYDEAKFQFSIGGTPVKLSDLRAWDNAGQVKWNDEAQHQWMLALDQGDFEAAALAASGNADAQPQVDGAGMIQPESTAVSTEPATVTPADQAYASSGQVEPTGSPVVGQPYGTQPAPQAAQPYGAQPTQQPYSQPYGAPQQGGVPPMQTPYGYNQVPAPAPKKKKTWLVVLIIVLVVLVLGCCGLTTWFGIWAVDQAENETYTPSGPAEKDYVAPTSPTSSYEEDTSFTPITIVDDDYLTVKLTEKWNYFGSLEYKVEVTNKSDIEIWLESDEDFTVDGATSSTSFMAYVNPGETYSSDIVFYDADGTAVSPKVSGTLSAEDWTNTFEVFATYPVSW